MNVSLTPKLERFVKAQVKSGAFNNASEVVRAALRLLEERKALHELKLKRLREAVAEGERSGFAEDFSWERLEEQLDAEVEAEATQRR
jgi:antitoxin ParD1/3/4